MHCIFRKYHTGEPIHFSYFNVFESSFNWLVFVLIFRMDQNEMNMLVLESSSHGVLRHNRPFFTTQLRCFYDTRFTPENFEIRFYICVIGPDRTLYFKT